MTKEEILEYIRHTPANSNIAVLSDMLDEYSSGGGGTSALIVELIDSGVEGQSLNKTWSEIDDAMPLVYVHGDQDGLDFFLPVFAVGEGEERYAVVVYHYMTNQPLGFETSSPDGYPATGK